MNGRLLMLEPASIAEYMALSETVQESVAQGYPVTVFVSPGWKSKGVSIGKAQKISYVNLEACREDSMEVVRRHTEGFAVIHYPDDVTYGIVVPRSLAGSKRNFDDKVLPVLVRSLERITVPNCYDPFPTRCGNVFANRKKIAGSAQNRNKNAWLQHGIIALKRRRAEDYTRYLDGEKDLARIEAQMTSVEEEGGIVDKRNLAAVIAEEFQRRLQDIDLKASSLSAEEIEYAERLLKSKYRNSDWLSHGTGAYDKSGRVGCFTE